VCWFIVGYRINTLVLIRNLELPPSTAKYVNYQSAAFSASQEQDLIAVFVFLCVLRGLKLLRLSPFTGPVIQSLLDTLKTRTVITYIGLFILVLISFSISFAIAFGNDIFEHRNTGEAFIRLLRAVFGDWDYEDLVESHRYLGPIFFVLFVTLASVFMMNLMIAILSEIYISVQKKNVNVWQRFVTKMMIDNNIRSQHHEGLISVPIFVVVNYFKLRWRIWMAQRMNFTEIVEQSPISYTEADMDLIAENAAQEEQDGTDQLDVWNAVNQLNQKLDDFSSKIDKRLDKLESILQQTLASKEVRLGASLGRSID